MDQSDPRYEYCQEDLAWARSVVNLRNAYIAARNEALSDYTDTMFTALETYLNNVFEAAIARETAKSAAERAYSEGEYDSYADYLDDMFTAAQNQGLGYAEASIMEHLGNAEAEKIAKHNRAETIITPVRRKDRVDWNSFG